VLNYELHLILIADKLRFFVLPLMVLSLFKGKSYISIGLKEPECSGL